MTRARYRWTRTYAEPHHDAFAKTRCSTIKTPEAGGFLLTTTRMPRSQTPQSNSSTPAPVRETQPHIPDSPEATERGTQRHHALYDSPIDGEEPTELDRSHRNRTMSRAGQETAEYKNRTKPKSKPKSNPPASQYDAGTTQPHASSTNSQAIKTPIKRALPSDSEDSDDEHPQLKSRKTRDDRTEGMYFIPLMYTCADTIPQRLLPPPSPQGVVQRWRLEVQPIENQDPPAIDPTPMTDDEDPSTDEEDLPVDDKEDEDPPANDEEDEDPPANDEDPPVIEEDPLVNNQNLPMNHEEEPQNVASSSTQPPPARSVISSASTSGPQRPVRSRRPRGPYPTLIRPRWPLRRAILRQIPPFIRFSFVLAHTLAGTM
ncbi:hypothetical protein FRC12_001088 [Ceratobasidium sp. 428]|nr:hypothetical protein FRC12_001088 [Ceratobasidium sp. 428]